MLSRSMSSVTGACPSAHKIGPAAAIRMRQRRTRDVVRVLLEQETRPLVARWNA